MLVPTPFEMYSTFFHAHPRKNIAPASNYGIGHKISHGHEIRKA